MIQLLIFQGDHIPPVFFKIVTSAEAVPVKQIPEEPQVFFLHPPGNIIGIFGVPVQIFPVHGDNSRRVLRLFHPSLNLQRTDSCPKKLRKNFHRAHILHIKRVIFSLRVDPVISGAAAVPSACLPFPRPVSGSAVRAVFYFFSDVEFFIRAADLERKSAYSGASTAVSASASQHTAEQALAGIGVAHGAVNKGFDFKSRFLTDLPNLVQRKFPGGNNPCKSLFL